MNAISEKSSNVMELVEEVSASTKKLMETVGDFKV
jgi:hypothetical protein